MLKKLVITMLNKLIDRDKFRDPLHLVLAHYAVQAFGSYRQKIDFDVIDRAQYAYGILKAADYAKSQGLETVTIIEFGVAFGGGLMNMVDISRKVTKETGVRFKIFGFDTGKGLPEPQDYRDHPELYRKGDYPMNFDALSAALPENAELVLGDISETVYDFSKNINPLEPIGFVSIDVDYYSSTKHALKIFESSNPECYLPITLTYFDDIRLESHNRFCGELLAISELNKRNELRKLEHNRFIESSRRFRHARWIKNMYFLHVLDHPIRSTAKEASEVKTMANPYLTFEGNVTDYSKE